jgi:murein L,D-transpeptidase YafK
VQDRVTAWAAAWSAKSFGQYAGFYAPAFEPADGSSRASWAQQRERRIAASKRVQVEVKNLKLREEGSDVLFAEFEQSYTSDTYSDVTQKSLKWIKVDGQWLIARETVQAPANGKHVRQKEGT